MILVHGQVAHDAVLAAPAPSTPLGPFQDSAMSWLTWATLMGFVGLVGLALVAVGPAARKIGGQAVINATVRLTQVAAVVGVLAVPAVLADFAYELADGHGYDYAAALSTLYHGTNSGRLLGLEVTCSIVGFLFVVPLTWRAVAAGRLRPWLLGGALLAGAVALGTTKFPTAVPEQWGRTSFSTGMWMLHLFGSAAWIGGLIGLLALALPGGVARGDRGAFWAPAIRRFSVMAMSCVAAIALSGIWLYWSHVDGPSQLFTTMYGRILGVKILIFGTLLLLGMLNQFWLHPRIAALRAAGEDRPLLSLLVRRFPVVVAAEVLLGLTVLLVAPFLHGSARNQAFQAHAAQTATASTARLPKIAAKQVNAATWVWGASETVVVITVMVAGYQVSGRVARRRADQARSATAPGRGDLVDA